LNRLEIFQKVYGTDHVFTIHELELLRQVTELVVIECANVVRHINCQGTDLGEIIERRMLGERL
jgi:hypothetical protein